MIPEVREVMLKQREAHFIEHFEALDDCERVSFIQRYLSNDRPYDSMLETPWPSDRAMMHMTGLLAERTGIGVEQPYIWCIRAYAGDQAWLRLVELWRPALGCDGPATPRTELLRLCSPALAAAIDSITTSDTVRKLLGIREAPRFRLEYNPYCLPRDSMIITLLGCNNESDALLRSDRAQFAYGHNRDCWQLVPTDPTAQFVGYVDMLNDNTLLMKLVRLPGTDCAYGIPVCSDGVGMLLERRDDGTTLFAVGRHRGVLPPR